MVLIWNLDQKLNMENKKNLAAAICRQIIDLHLSFCFWRTLGSPKAKFWLNRISANIWRTWFLKLYVLFYVQINLALFHKFVKLEKVLDRILNSFPEIRV